MIATNVPTIVIRRAVSDDAAAIAGIYNQGIAARHSTFETRPRTAEDIAVWLTPDQRYPVLVAEQDGALIGWANLSSYRPRECYAGIAEFSIYLDGDVQRRGVGARLLQALIDCARESGFHKLVSRIFPENVASLALCRKLGFRQVGSYQRHAQLDGVWRDVVIVERWLPDAS
jgi:phosphinothricin acetyltransferase